MHKLPNTLEIYHNRLCELYISLHDKKGIKYKDLLENLAESCDKYVLIRDTNNHNQYKRMLVEVLDQASIPELNNAIQKLIM